MIIIPLPWPKPPLTGNRTRGNPYARAKEVEQAKGEAVMAVRAANPMPVLVADVTLHYYLPDRRRRDADGMFPTLKVCLDALVTCAVLPDDSWTHVPAATCRIHGPDRGLHLLHLAATVYLELTNVTYLKATA